MSDENVPTPLPGGQRTPPPPQGPAAPPAASSDPEPATEWEALIAEGKNDGRVTTDRVDAVFRALNIAPPADLRPVYDALNAMGIDVIA